MARITGNARNDETLSKSKKAFEKEMVLKESRVQESFDNSDIRFQRMRGPNGPIADAEKKGWMQTRSQELMLKTWKCKLNFER